jgi:opine dehydrogenase
VSNDVAILGAGNGGCAAAADLTLRGHNVSLFDFKDKRLKPLREKGGVELTGAVGEGFAEIVKITGDIREAVKGVDQIIIIFPTPAHHIFSELLAPVVEENQTIILNPGGTGGALSFKKKLRELGIEKRITVCETNTMTYICRIVEPGKVRVTLRSKFLFFSSLPSQGLDSAYARFKELYPSAQKAETVLETSLLNPNAIMHTAIMILNAGWIESTGGDFRFYYEGSSPSVSNVVEKVDQERIGVANSMNIKTMPFLEYFYRGGYTSERAYKEGSFFLALKDSEINRFIRAPKTLKHRFIEEDVEFGLVPYSSLGDQFGASTPTIDSLIHLSSVLNQKDYWETGATVKKMGIEGFSKNELYRYLQSGML